MSRWIEYRRAHVRIDFVPIVKVMQPPPYVGWTVAAYTDTQTKAVVSRRDVAQKLQDRLRLSPGVAQKVKTQLAVG